MSFWNKFNKEPELTPEQLEEEQNYLTRAPKRTLSGETTQIIHNLAHKVEEEVQKRKLSREKMRQITESLKECNNRLKND